MVRSRCQGLIHYGSWMPLAWTSLRRVANKAAANLRCELQVLLVGRMTQVFGIEFSSLDEQAILDRFSANIQDGGGPRLLVTTNMDHVVNLAGSSPSSEEYREAYSSAWIATADGWPVFLYARLRGAKIPSRITGADLVKSLFSRLEPERHKIFVIGSNAATCESLSRSLEDRGFDSACIGWAVPEFGFETDERRSADIARRVREHRTTHLFMGVGSPKSEVWVYKNRDALGDVFAFGFGAGLDFLAGTQDRSPRWMQKVGLEWLWRLAHEPRRLGPRYLFNSWRFFGAIKRDLQFSGRLNSPQ